MPVQSPEHPNLWVYEHPVIQDKLCRIRDRETKHAQFRRLLNEIAGLMFFQISRTFETTDVVVETPMGQTSGRQLSHPVTLVPVLRAGIGMTDGILAMIPDARVGHIGVYRDESSLKPVQYYCKLPQDIGSGPVLLIDPMLATGGSASHAATILREHGCDDLQMVCLVTAPEGVRRMQQDHPDMLIYAASLDDGLDDRGYIIPGLGDAGDRIFGTF
ncbi:MAG: uracil phosphoribosyltransferase [Phycisphaerales bacterium]|jgi:uracil phosphoribosyltransferase|nr:uracil phosphoribosyltransferase [Phycisphaerales bacterium]